MQVVAEQKARSSGCEMFYYSFLQIEQNFNCPEAEIRQSR